MKATADRRRLSPSVLVRASLVALMAAATLATALVVAPAPLGWIGFGVMSLIVVGLGLTAVPAVARALAAAEVRQVVVRPAEAGDCRV